MTERPGGTGRDSFIPIGDTRLGREFERRARQQLKPPTPSQQRIIDAASAPCTLQSGTDKVELLFQHASLCQTFLPYRNPGDDRREWERTNGFVHLRLIAGEAWDDPRSAWMKLGLPYGPKARLALMHVNQRAILSQSPVIDVGTSLTSFVSRSLGLDTGGRTINAVKEQLGRLSASSIRFGGRSNSGRSTTDEMKIVAGFEMWSPKEGIQRGVGPEVLTLSKEYWEHLKEHAVPLDERHIRALSHSGMALDIYTWLAHRLHRIPETKPAFVTWPLLHDQFGAEIAGLRNFRRMFRIALKQVLALYPGAKIAVMPGGLVLRASPPIIKPRLSIVCG